MATRRTVRSFSTEPIPPEVLENIIKTAGTMFELKNAKDKIAYFLPISTCTKILNNKYRGFHERTLGNPLKCRLDMGSEIEIVVLCYYCSNCRVNRL